MLLLSFSVVFMEEMSLSSHILSISLQDS